MKPLICVAAFLLLALLDAVGQTPAPLTYDQVIAMLRSGDSASHVVAEIGTHGTTALPNEQAAADLLKFSGGDTVVLAMRRPFRVSPAEVEQRFQAAAKHPAMTPSSAAKPESGTGHRQPLTADMVYSDVRMGFAPAEIVAKIKAQGCLMPLTAQQRAQILRFAGDAAPVVEAMEDPRNLVPASEVDPSWARVVSPLPDTPPTATQLAARAELRERDAELTRAKERLAAAQVELASARAAATPAPVVFSPPATTSQSREIVLRRGEHRLLSEMGGPNEWVTYGGADALAVHMAIGPGSGRRQDFPTRCGLEGSRKNLTLIVSDANACLYYVDTVRRQGDEGVFLIERSR